MGELNRNLEESIMSIVVNIYIIPAKMVLRENLQRR